MPELLTRELAKEYLRRANEIPHNGLQDVGERRELRIELQRRCGITGLQAINVLNGFHISDYVAIYKRRADDEKRRNEARDEDV